MISPNHHSPDTKFDQLLADQDPIEGSIVLSDFDYTLCHKYVFDSHTNDHLPYIDPDIIEAARGTHLVIATGRRANSQSLRTIWEDGLIPKDRPVIAENGGAFVYYSDDRLRFLDLIPPYAVNHIVTVKEELEAQAEEIQDREQELIVKLGRTMLIARLQGKDGETNPESQHRLKEAIAPLIADTELDVVDNRVSLGVQHQAVNKGSAFMRYIHMQNVDPSRTMIIGMGDGENDKDIFRVADISIGLSPIVGSLVDIELVEGSESARAVLQKVSNVTIGL